MRILALLLVLLLVSSCSKKQEVTRPPFVCAVLVTGKSMLPTYMEYEMVRLSLADYSALKKGDTVIRWHELTKQYIHHRVDIFDSRTGAWYTKGDNNPTTDRSLMFRADFVGTTSKL